MADAVHRKDVSPAELVELHLERIEELNPKLNAYVDLRAKEARAEAAAAEAAVLAGAELGAMHGVPISIKSSIDVAGMKCEAGSRIRLGYVPQQDAVPVSRLRAAGAIVLGVTNTPEFLMAYETDNDIYGRTSNPWDLARTAGGSSGGEAAAVAACMSAAGVGSDGGGSVRVPAHFTGICGLKPTPGRIPATGHFPQGVGPLAWIGSVGPMARTVADLHLMLGILAGEDVGDPVSVPVPLVEVDESELRRVTVGYFEDDGLHPVTEETRASVRMAAEALCSQGFEVTAFRPDGLERARELWYDVFGRIGGLAFAPLLDGKEEQLSPILNDLRAHVATQPPLTASGLLNALFERDILRERVLRQMEQFPVLVTPVSTGPAFRHNQVCWTTSPESFLNTMVYSQWFNLLGFPAAVVPVSQSQEGLPIGVQVVGRPFEDELVLAVAAAIEAKFGYQEPPLLKREGEVSL
ncbi:MAG TPA: amidase [Terriglobales bacterium]|nr:amidase [Terriglobales bacterium]